ncbi:MAG TPA: hypothetical protein DCZ92_06905 [Elusimicrobia bacterium]|nr:MAG: hypothetical protein A2016_05060 [Elusimicrobia bacterium GWF2_62_30]HBA60534.1 hypothetical protein [Elusimicrobiota bacterium]
MSDNIIYFLTAAIIALFAAHFIAQYVRSRSADEWSPPKKGSRMALLGINARLRDFYRLAVLIEEGGREVYLELARMAKTPETRALCSGLAESEAAHKQLFQDYIERWDTLPPNKAEWPVLLEQMKKAGIFEDRPARGAREDELAWWAIRQEIKTADFYLLFEHSFPDSWRKLRMHELVQEEREHERKIRSAYPHLPA